MQNPARQVPTDPSIKKPTQPIKDKPAAKNGKVQQADRRDVLAAAIRGNPPEP
jgi:hypothetical protein